MNHVFSSKDLLCYGSFVLYACMSLLFFAFVGTTTNRKSIIHFKMGELINKDIELVINEDKLIN